MTLYVFNICFDSLWLEDTLIDLFIGINNESLNMLYLTNLTSNISINTPFSLSSPFTTTSKVKQDTISGPILCCSSIGDYPKYCLKTEKSIVIKKKNYPPSFCS